jgi:hypothetical protein
MIAMQRTLGDKSTATAEVCAGHFAWELSKLHARQVISAFIFVSPVTDEELARLDVVDAVEFAILEHHQDILEDDLLRDARIVDGRRRVSYGSWQWVLKKTVRIVIETCRKVLELNANDPDVDVLRLRLAEKAPWQLTETWRSITHDSRLGLPDSGDIDLEPGPLGVDEHVDAEARTITKDILAILPAQGGLFVWEDLNAQIDREQAELDKANAAANALIEKISSMTGASSEPQPVRERAGEPGTRDQAVTSEAVWRIPRESFEAFVEKVRTIRRVSKSDIDFAAGYSDRSTREDLEAGRGNSRSHAKYTRVLQMEPSKFVAELDALNNSAKSRIVPQNPA